MKKSTLEYARHVIESQRKHAADPRSSKTQRAYTEGLEKMLEIILTEGYTKEG